MKPVRVQVCRAEVVRLLRDGRGGEDDGGAGETGTPAVLSSFFRRMWNVVPRRTRMVGPTGFPL
jgi:hypothetical protein